MGASHGDASVAQIDAEIMGIGDELEAAMKEGKEGKDRAYFEERLTSLKTKLRIRERMGRR